jgi:outer membrane autotransporter protein
LVDQPGNGVFLQWTTPINAATMGAHAQADVAAALNASQVLEGVANGITDGTVARRDICVQPTADAPTTFCDPTGFSVWAQIAASRSSFDAVDGFSEFDADTWSFAGGVDYAIDGNWKIGAFGAYAKTDADLGSVNGIFGPRDSEADIEAGYGGGYVSAVYDNLYLTIAGMAGQAQTDLVNGVLFNATSDYDSFIWGLSGTIGAVMDLDDSGWAIDPRLSVKYVETDADEYRDSFGLGIDSGTEDLRVAATLGLLYQPQDSGFSLAARAGVAYADYSTEVEAFDPITGTSASVTRDQDELMFTGSLDATFVLDDNITINAIVSGDLGEDIETIRGNLGVSFKLN